MSAEAVAKINNAAEQLEGSAEPESDDFESVTAKVQAILAKEGNVHISSVAPVVR